MQNCASTPTIGLCSSRQIESMDLRNQLVFQREILGLSTLSNVGTVYTTADVRAQKSAVLHHTLQLKLTANPDLCIEASNRLTPLRMRCAVLKLSMAVSFVGFH